MDYTVLVEVVESRVHAKLSCSHIWILLTKCPILGPSPLIDRNVSHIPTTWNRMLTRTGTLLNLIIILIHKSSLYRSLMLNLILTLKV